MAKKEFFDPQEENLDISSDSSDSKKEIEPNFEVLKRTNPDVLSGDAFSEIKEDVDFKEETEPSSEEIIKNLNPDTILGSEITEQGIKEEAQQEKIQEFKETAKAHIEEKAKKAKEAREAREERKKEKEENKETWPQIETSDLEKDLIEIGIDSIEPLLGPKLDSKIKIKALAIFKERADDFKIKSAQYWYQKNKKQLEKKGIVPDSETDFSIYRFYLNEKGENDLADDKEYLEIIKDSERYDNIIAGLSEEKPLVETYYSAMKEINNFIEKEKQDYASKAVSLSGKGKAGELEKAQITANLKIQDLAEAGVKLAESFTDRNFKEEAEKTIPKTSREEYVSLDSIREKKLEFMKNLKTDEEIDVLKKYGWKVEIKKPGLFSLGHTIYKRNGVVMRDIETNLFGSYNRDEKKNFVRNALHTEIKKDLNDDFDKLEKENKKQINNYRFAKFLEILENPEENINEYVKRKNQESFQDVQLTKKTKEDIQKIIEYFGQEENLRAQHTEKIEQIKNAIKNIFGKFISEDDHKNDDFNAINSVNRGMAEKIKGINNENYGDFIQ